MFTLCVLLFAMVGNAQIRGIDLVLTMLGPPCVFLYVLSGPTFSKKSIYLGLLFAVLGYALLLLATRFEPLNGHVFWPVKAVILALLLSQISPRIHKSQVYFLFALVLILFLTSLEQSGRSYGLFGPNMLYRFYGLLLLASLYMVYTRETGTLMWIGFCLLSIIGISRTGSVGGLLLVAVAGLIFLRPSIKSLGKIAAIFIALFLLWSRISELIIFQRLLYKMDFDEFIGSYRVDGILRVLSEGFSPIGHPYDTFNHTWRLGYDYPHNIFVELFAFYGILGILTSLILIGAFLISWRKIQRKDSGFFDIAFIALFIGTLLSGDLGDNYGVIGLAISITGHRFLPLAPGGSSR